METLYRYFIDSSGVCTDSRNIHKDCFFVAIKGPVFNGNTFARQAIEKGAKYAIVDEREFERPDENIFYVDNGLEFLQQLANHHRRQFDIPVIGITGSNGKTSTKELIAAVLSEKYTVLATKGNLNNHIGVPLTLLQLKSEHEIAVVEMGANHFGDIKELCDIAEPTYGIITNVGKAHLEGFKNFEGVLQTKKELYKAVEYAEGLIVYNADDAVLKEQLPANTLLMSYGTKDAEITGKLERLTPFAELFWSKTDYTSPLLKTRLVGEYNFYNFLAAIAFGSLFEVEADKINKAIEYYEPTNKRSQVAQTQKNTLILDCYNANPTSMRSALESFAQIEHPDKYFIIGDMLELGDESYTEHRAIIDLVEQLGLKGMTVGNEFSYFQSECVERDFYSTKELIEQLKQHPVKGKMILLKGSRGIGLEVLEEYL